MFSGKLSKRAMSRQALTLQNRQKKPQVRISRQRLTFDEWMMIYNAAEKDGYFLQRGMLLALMTGQRLSDICKMQFSDIRDGYLHVEQQKNRNPDCHPSGSALR